jgi:Glycosyl hydrolase family 26
VSRRSRFGLTAAIAAVVVAALVATAVLLITRRQVNGGAAAASQPAIPHVPASSLPHRGGDVLVPKSGAYLGAYVEPKPNTPQGQIRAVLKFERRLRHSIEIVHEYQPWGTVFPTASEKHFADRGKIVLISWSGAPNTEAIIAGKDDAMIRSTAEAVKALHHPILMEFRHEMDRPNLQWTLHGPADYIAAWDHIRAIFTAVGARNVGWVWCPTAYGFQIGRAQPFYPGNKEVDWVCADVYSSSVSVPMSKAAAPFLQWASHRNKPVIIGEFGVAGDPPKWASWLRGAGQLARRDPQIKAMAYFDANGINSTGSPYFFWLGSHPSALREFAALLRQPYFHPHPPGDP